MCKDNMRLYLILLFYLATFRFAKEKLVIIYYTIKFLLNIFFIYISNVIPFPSFPSENPLSPTPFFLLLYPFPFPGHGIALYRGIEPS